ncbi:hypothetical protein ABH935_000066 [Catenulispora sp. GAS73]|uniref:EboA domain-containing protein n=1 Tax=Catenulispora sp. GAS73 TaxID=3156269 RepID=UPI00351581AE
MTAPISVHDLEAAFSVGAPDRAREWLACARRQVARDRGELQMLFPVAARACGRAPLPLSDGWSTDDAARVLVLAAMAWPDLDELRGLYDHGDADEKRAVLLALDFIEIGDGGLAIVEDALRTNDTRLITASLGRHGASRLTPAAYRQAVLKCVFCGIPLAAVSGLDDRADAELAQMLEDFVRERSVAGRAVPDDVRSILARFP